MNVFENSIQPSQIVGREIALDTETTGLKPSDGHRIIEIGCVEMVNRIKTGNVFHVYINPKRKIPDVAYKIHGLSEEFLKDKPIFEDIAEDFLEFIGDSTLVIHNAQFDMKFINAELTNIRKRNVPNSQVFCTLLYARNKFPGSPASLDALCRRFGVNNQHRTKHGALLDAELLADMYLDLMGGSQVSLELAGQKHDNNQELTTIINKKLIQSRNYTLTKAQLKTHQQFIEDNINESLWGGK